MDKEKKIHQQIEETIRSLDHMEQAKTDDYFFTRLQARMQNKQEKTVASPSRLSWSIAAVMIIVLINILTLIHYNNTETSTTEESEQVRQEELNAFAEEYVFTVPTLYEQNSDQ